MVVDVDVQFVEYWPTNITVYIAENPPVFPGMTLFRELKLSHIMRRACQNAIKCPRYIQKQHSSRAASCNILNFQDVPILRSSPDLPKTGSNPPRLTMVDVGTWVLVPCCKPTISIQSHTRNIHVTTFRLLMSSLSDSWIHRYVCFPGVSLKKMTDC